MRGFVALLRKEWRDARTMFVACVLLAPIALIIAEACTSVHDGPRVAAQLVVPALITLFALVIAADLVAADVASGRAGTYALLPTGPGTSGLAKLTYLSIVVIAFACWTYASALLVQLAGKNPGDAWTVIELTPKTLWVLAFAIPVMAAVLLASTLAHRGFTAVCGGCILVAGLAAVAVAVDWVGLEFVPTKYHALCAGLVVAWTFLAGAAVAFVKGPVHAGPLVRRVVLALAVPVGVLVPASAAAAAVLHERAQVEIGDPRVAVHPLRWSPDGNHLLVIAARKDNRNAIHRVWSLDVRSGAIAPLAVKGLELATGFAWTDSGARFVASKWYRNPDALTYEFDLATGEIVRTRSVGQIESSGESVFETDDDFASTAVEGGRRWTDRRCDGSLLVPSHFTEVSTQSMAGRLLLRDTRDGSLHVGIIPTGNIARVAAAHDGVHLSPGGRYAVAWQSTSHTYFDVERSDGTPVVYRRYGTSSGSSKGTANRTIIDLENTRIACVVQEPYGTAFPGGGSPHHLVAFGHDEPTLLVDLRDGSRTLLDPDPNAYGTPWDLVKVRSDGDYALVDPDGRLLLFEADTGTHRVLYAPRTED